MIDFCERRVEHRFDIEGRLVVAVLVHFRGRLFIERLSQVVRRPRAYGEVQRRLWPRQKPNAVARAALAYFGASDRGLIPKDRAAALARVGG